MTYERNPEKTQGSASLSRIRRSNRPFYLFDTKSLIFHEIKDGTLIGRTEGQITFPEDSLMSRRHLLFHQIEQELIVRDLETQNGTRVNHMTLAPRDSHILTIHDVIEIGERTFIFTRQNQYRPQPRQQLVDRERERQQNQELTISTDPDREVTQITGPTERSEAKALSAKAKSAEVTSGEDEIPTQRIRLPRRKWAKWVPVAIAMVVIGIEAADYFTPPDTSARKTSKTSKAPETANGRRPDMPLSQSLKIGDDWEAWNIDLAAGAIYLRNLSVLGRKSPVAAMSEDSEMIARVLGGSSVSATSAFIANDPAAESVADRACDKLIDAGARWTPTPFKQVFEDLDAAGSSPTLFGADDESFGPLPVALINARLSTIRYPRHEGRFELGSVLIHCGAPAGSRIATANAFATSFFALRAKQALAVTLQKHEAKRQPSLTKKFQLEGLRSVRLSTLIRASRNVDLRLAAHQGWLKESAEATAALPAEIRQSFAASTGRLRELNRAEMERWETEYEAGRKSTPSAFPPIRPEALLEEADLLFLKAY